MKSIIEAFHVQCSMNPHRLAVADYGSLLQTLTYGELRELATVLGGHLQQAGVCNRDTVAVDFADQLLLILTLIALLQLDVRSVVICSHGCQPKDPHHSIVSDRLVAGFVQGRDYLVGPQSLKGPSRKVHPGKLLACSPEVFVMALGPVAANQVPEIIELRAAMLQESTARYNQIGVSSGRDIRICVSDIRSASGFTTLLSNLRAGRSLIVASETYDDDVQIAELFHAETVEVQASTARAYFATLTTKRGLIGGLQTAVIHGIQFDVAMLGLIKERVAGTVTAVVGSPQVGPLAQALFDDTDMPLDFHVLPGVRLRSSNDDSDNNADADELLYQDEFCAGEEGVWRPCGILVKALPEGLRLRL
jgi:hypothetical protein